MEENYSEHSAADNSQKSEVRSRRQGKSKLIGFAVFFLLLSIIPHTVFAATQGGIEVRPAYIDVDLTEKASQQALSITYVNRSTTPITLELYPIDFRQNNPNGGVGFVQSSSEYLYSLSSFLSFETSRLDLDPGEEKTLTVVARNRQDLTPGGHYAAVIARQVQQNASETIVAPAVSTLIFLRKLGGESYNLSLKNMSWPTTVTLSYPPTITLLFQNEGNTHLVPTGHMEVTDVFGRLLYKGIVNEGFVKVLPESTRYVPIYLKQLAPSLPFSINTMRLTGTDSLHKVTFSRTDVFLYIHPLVILLGIILIGYLVFRHSRRKGKAVVVDPAEKVKQVTVKRRRATRKGVR